ncbi:Gfo/Idh/MocA family oxidoreductase [Pseudonocardia sp. C8]|uniref:Gfo/Idh/MocA family protein n=1 Tax=Pseudonocardia sp. C8 TaxID=2762759 RepID=UPI001642DDD4|nr:Gfo/Idh/MocA family oxidoreductase [Pseudonocardia sp. C8]MBC3194684.1 Gfo/Idh/MocA family oxidoreductase [Pseudonocardia sp. C8]
MRIGLVGAGPWARSVHAPAIAAHPRWAAAGVWARRPEAAGEVTAISGGSAYASFDALLEACDAVAFAVPPEVQATLVPWAAAAGKHVVLEKPLAVGLADAERAAAAVDAAGVCSVTVLTLRFAPEVRDWLAAIGDGPCGPETVGTARWLSGALLGGPFASARWRAEHGALLDVGPHVIDLLDAALGPVDAVEQARRDEPDLWRIGLRHAGGARSSLVLSLRTPVDPTEFEVAVVGGVGPDGRGRFRLDRRPADPVAGYTSILDDLAAAVDAGDRCHPAGVHRALHLQRIIEEIRRLAAVPA